MKISEQEKIEKIIKILEEEIYLLQGDKIVQNSREYAKYEGLQGLKEYLEGCLKRKSGIDDWLEKQGKTSLRSEWPQIESIIEDC